MFVFGSILGLGFSGGHQSTDSQHRRPAPQTTCSCHHTTAQRNVFVIFADVFEHFCLENSLFWSVASKTFSYTFPLFCAPSWQVVSVPVRKGSGTGGSGSAGGGGGGGPEPPCCLASPPPGTPTMATTYYPHSPRYYGALKVPSRVLLCARARTPAVPLYRRRRRSCNLFWDNQLVLRLGCRVGHLGQPPNCTEDSVGHF